MSAAYSSDINIQQDTARDEAIEYLCIKFSTKISDDDRDWESISESSDEEADQRVSGEEDSGKSIDNFSDDCETESSLIEGSLGGEPKIIPEGRKCWRCRILREKCDSEDECVYCFDDRTIDDERQNWFLDCSRGLLATEMEEAFSGIYRISGGIWCIEDAQGRFLILKISYGNLTLDELLESTVRTPITPTDRFMTYREFKFSLGDFLQQFFTLESRWGEDYEPITYGIIQQAAKFQLAWCQRANLIPTDLLDGSNMIAAAFYCLVLSHEIDQVSTNWVPGYTLSAPDAFHENLAIVERHSNKGHYPSVDIYALAKGSHIDKTESNGRHTLGSILRIILQTAQSILYRGRPEDEPYIFYIIYILMLVLNNLRPAYEWTGALKPAREGLYDSLYDLCHMFHLSTNNFHPLNSDFDIEVYASSVDGNMLVTEHYRLLHQVWINSSDPDDPQRDADDLWTNLDSLVHGM